jgi:penicillin-binding protein 2
MEEIRKYIVQIVFVLVGLVYAIKLFQIQILDSTYKLAADNNVIRRETRYAYRGLIYDRNGKLLVHNEPAFDLMVVPREVRVADTVRFCRLLGITKDSFIQRIKDARSFDLHQPSVFMKMISPAEFARFGDHLVDFSGFYIQPRSLRGYDYPVFANGLGYIGEVSKEQLARDTSGYYRQGDYIGVSGLEAYYEKELRGQNGVQYNMVNVRGVVKGPFRNGRYDTLSVAGLNLVSSIDVDLQAYGEWLFENLAGAVVAIEPSSGEILALVSAPSYDPSMLSGRLVGENFATLTQDSLTPLYNRSIMSFQPPGSTFKPLQSLIALQEGVLGPEERIFCSGGLVGDHAPPGYYSVFSAIQHSSNNFFYIVFRRIINRNLSPNTFIDSRLGLETWNNYLYDFGLGKPLGVDLPNEKGGIVPSPAYYDRIYGANRWKWSTINSISIGQGEVLLTPIQLANYMCIVANRGHYYTPHLIKSIGDTGKPRPEYQEKHTVNIDPAHFDVVIDAMESVIQGGTGFRAQIPGIEVCGKTGTSQNPHGEDHSVFVAFAPKENPRIAVAVYVQNAGQGARSAASIAGLVMEKYLTGEVKRKHIEDFVKAGHFVY